MKTVFRLVFLAAIAVLGVWLWTILFPGPEKVVLKKISSLAATATVNAQDSNLIRAAKAANLVDFFTTDAEIILNTSDLPNRTLSGREEIQETAQAIFANVKTLNVQFLDVTAQIGADKKTADVNCTVKVNAGDSKDYGVEELHFQFKKVDGTWLISRMETVKTLS
jgi:ketosteroid isomerase-like protein